MITEKWFDCYGAEIKDGDVIVDIHSGKHERVYECHAVDDPDTLRLGINASNEKFLELHPFWPREIYPFSEFGYRTVKGKKCLLDYRKEA